jgi:peptide/nickel transport system substrate-binding protein
MRARTRWPGIWIALFVTIVSAQALAQSGERAPGELVWAIRYDPKTFDPAKVDEQVSEAVRFLTGGVLLRLNPQTQQPEPDLAESWSVSDDGRVLSFRLRSGLHFSNGTSLTSQDVAWSLRRVVAPATAAPVAEEFLAPQLVSVETPDALSVIVRLPQRVIGIGKVFDEIAIEPAGRPSEGRVTSGPFTVADYKQGQYVRLKANPNYWRRDAAGVQLPYASGIRLEILNNREQEIARFQRGVYDLIDVLPPEYYALLAQKNPKAVRDLGPSLNTEQMWFNQSPNAALPDFEKAWFENRVFRVAISQAIHRADLARIAYDGHATPAYGFISPANTLWYNTRLQVPHEDAVAAARLLSGAGFHRKGEHLYDAGGHQVKFSILTNSGNRARLKMATLIQQDLAALGIDVRIVTLDFPALIERLMHTMDYEACLLGLSNVDPDPNAMVNLWQSSSPNHQWDPSEKKPATAWEAQIDKDMGLQASSPRPQDRKRAIDEVQQIVADQQPFIYLVYPNALYAVSPQLGGVKPTIFQPGIVWNVARLHLLEGKP